MVKIVKADQNGNINITEEELNILLKESYNDGYDKGYAHGRSMQWLDSHGYNSDCIKTYTCASDENGILQ